MLAMICFEACALDNFYTIFIISNFYTTILLIQKSFDIADIQ